MVPAQSMVFSVSPVVWITVIIVLVVLFGASKLPDIARNVGKSAKVLKEELTDLTAEDQAEASKSSQLQSAPASPPESAVAPAAQDSAENPSQPE